MTDLKEKVIEAYNEVIEAQNKQIKRCHDEITTCTSCILDAEKRKQDLAKECTSLLKKIDEEKIDSMPAFKLSTSDGIKLSKEDCKKANDWVIKHEVKFHPKSFLGLEHVYKGVSPVSKYELRKGWSSIGDWVSLVCTECKEKGVDDCEYDIQEIGG